MALYSMLFVSVTPTMVSNQCNKLLSTVEGKSVVVSRDCTCFDCHACIMFWIEKFQHRDNKYSTVRSNAFWRCPQNLAVCMLLVCDK